MKYILLSFICLCIHLTYSQNNCLNEISTNPNAPENSTLPNTQFGSSTTVTFDDQRFINNFDWLEGQNIQLQNMQDNQNMVPLDFDSAPFYNYISDGEKMTPENGWELMLYNVGKFPDQTDCPYGNRKDIPYIALYNKYTGILRVFAVYGSGSLPTGTSYAGVIVNLQFELPSEVNGIFRLRNGGDISLDEPTQAMHTQSVAFHLNSPAKWFSVDFQLAYDPCICFYPSDLRLRFDFVTELEINLYGRSITVEDEIANGNGILMNNFLTNFQFDGSNTEDQIVMYEVMEDFIDDYINKLKAHRNKLAQVNEHNKEVEKKIVLLKLFKKVIIAGASYATGGLVNEQWFPDLVQYASEFIPYVDTSANAIEGYKTKLKKTVSEFIGQKADSYIQKNFTKQDKPIEPTAPMASFTEMRMTGSITSLTPIYSSSFFSPGSYGTSTTGSPIITDPLTYPIYNNLVGNFALLNTPKIIAYKTKDTINEFSYVKKIPILDSTAAVKKYWKYIAWNRKYQFQLGDEIFYTLNHCPDIKSYDISVSFQGKCSVDTMGYVGSIQAYFDHENSVNTFSNDVNTNEFYPLKVSDGKGFNYGRNYCDSTLLQSNICQIEEYDLPNLQYSKDTIDFYTDYYPIDALAPLVFSVGIANQKYMSYTGGTFNFDPFLHGFSFENFDFDMRIIVDVIYNKVDGDGENITGTYMFKYDINNILWVDYPLDTNLQNTQGDYGAYQENLIFDSTNFDGSEVQGCKLDGNHYTCHGWDDVTIVGDLVTSNGFTASIYGGNSVFVLNESEISPEIILEVKSLLDYSHPMPEADSIFISKYCLKQNSPELPNYGASSSTKKALLEYESLKIEHTIENVQLTKRSITTCQSRRKNLIKIHSKIPLSSESITITDTTGRIIHSKFEKLNSKLYRVDTENISTGWYYLVVYSNQGSVRKKIRIRKKRNWNLFKTEW